MELQTTLISTRAATLLSVVSRFKVKSVFENAINLEASRAINLEAGCATIAIQTPRTAFTPLTVQVAYKEFGRLQALKTGMMFDVCARGGRLIDCGIRRTWRAPARNWVNLLVALALVLARDGSLVVPATGRPVVRLGSANPLQQKVGAILAEAETRLREGQADEAAYGLSALIGLGPGLTPSGDDFLIGVLAACRHWGCGQVYTFGQALAARLAVKRVDTTWLSNALIGQALEGQFAPALATILDSTDSGLAKAVGAGVSWGHTSGSDTVGGIIWASRMALPWLYP
jgi:hypothetical protein